LIPEEKYKWRQLYCVIISTVNHSAFVLLDYSLQLTNRP